MPVSRDLGFLLREQGARFGPHAALIGNGDTLGYDVLCDRAARIASFLAARGVTRGDRIGLLMNNRPEWVETFFGAAMAGRLGGLVINTATHAVAAALGWVMGATLPDARPAA